MEISFINNKLQKTCEDHSKLKSKYGAQQAQRIVRRINELQAAANLYDITQLPQVRLHPLHGDRKGQFAVDIVHPYRIILLPMNGDVTDLRTVTIVEIKAILDYH